jgi:hypothetical protein
LRAQFSSRHSSIVQKETYRNIKTCFFYHVSEAYIVEAERKMQLAADPDSCAYEEDTEIGAELEKEEEATVDKK